MGNTISGGILERFCKLTHKLTSLTGGFMHMSTQKFIILAHVCVITKRFMNDKIQFLQFSISQNYRFDYKYV